MKTTCRLVRVLVFACGLAAANLAAVEPLANGSLGYVNARDGDSMFNVSYFSEPDFRGKELVTRLEPSVGAGKKPTEVQDGQIFSATWSGTVNPRKSGLYTLVLQAPKDASLWVDGAEVLRSGESGEFSKEIELSGGQPYEFIIRIPHLTGDEKVSASWSMVEKSGGPAKESPDREQIVMASSPQEPLQEVELKNARYRVRSLADGSFTVTESKTNSSFAFQPEFTVVVQRKGAASPFLPRGARYVDDGPVGATNYFVPVWGKSPDYLAAAQPRYRMRAEGVRVESGRLEWSFPSHPDFILSAYLEVREDGSEPEIGYILQPKSDGIFSVGYVGAPKVPMGKADWIWQPLVWQEKRFPNLPYMTLEYQCPIPFVLVGEGGNSVGVGADPKEMPFRMATGENSRFGVLVRNAAGEAQPQIYAPVLGGEGSQRKAGENYQFRLRLYVGDGSWFNGYSTLAQALYGFSDQRENGLCSLNTTIENMTDFFLNDDLCYWYPDSKSWGYQNDAGPEGIRQQSAAYALGLALTLDREDVLKRRAMPTLEYMLTRQKLEAQKNDFALLGGPAKVSVDFVAAHRLLLARNPSLKAAALQTSPVMSKGQFRPPKSSRGAAQDARVAFLNALALYRVTGDAALLQEAQTAADTYIQERIEKPSENYADALSSFWTELAPAYDGLYELYEETGEQRYLEAAGKAMESFSAFIYLAPKPPATDFTANPGGEHNGVKVAEEKVPAWRVSPVGLAAECAATSHSHNVIFMASYAGYMARLGRDLNQPFFRDIARNSTVGRYANYPSYAYRKGFTTMFEKPDYPLRPFSEIKKVTSAHYNHPLPMVAFLVDFLISDIYARSDGQISFPSEYTSTGAYFRSKVYGARAGKFYDARDVFLWMPPKLVQLDSLQLNYLAARGEGRLYLAFSNQSDSAVEAVFRIDPARVDLGGRHECQVWIDNKPANPMFVEDGRGQIRVPAKGLVAVAIDNVGVKTAIQEAMLDKTVAPFAENSSKVFPTRLGKVKATALSYGRGFSTVHIMVAAGKGEFEKVILTWTEDGETRRIERTTWPYEFTVPIADNAKVFDFSLEAGSEYTGPLQLTLR